MLSSIGPLPARVGWRGRFPIHWKGTRTAGLLVLTIIVGIWAVMGGCFEIFAAFSRGETAGTRALFILGGLVSIVFGVVLFARPGIGAVILALLFGLFALMYGISQIVLGVQVRDTGRTVRSVLPDAA